MLETYRAIAEAYGRLSFLTKAAMIAAVAAATTAFGIAVVVWLPPDHFTRPERANAESWWRSHPVLRWTGLVIKNALGLLFLPLGIVMSLPLVPGPGLVFILLGLSLLDFPGKRRLEARLFAVPTVSRFLNDVRARFQRPPLEVPPRHHGAGG